MTYALKVASNKFFDKHIDGTSKHKCSAVTTKNKVEKLTNATVIVMKFLFLFDVLFREFRSKTVETEPFAHDDECVKSTGNVQSVRSDRNQQVQDVNIDPQSSAPVFRSPYLATGAFCVLCFRKRVFPGRRIQLD